MWGIGTRHGGAPAYAELPARDVRTKAVQSSLVAFQVTLAGTTEPIRRATPSARIMAKVLFAHFQEGQRVEANQVLVRLDTRDLAARRTQASAGEEAATTGLNVAEVNLRRMRSLVEAGAASKAQLEAVEVATAQARAATKTARAAIDEVDTNVSYASVASPFAGVVVQKMTEPGNIVGPGQPLFVVEDDSRLRIVAPIGSEDAAKIAPDEKVRVRFGDEIREGILEGIIPSGDPRAPGLRVQILIENADLHLRPGILAVVEIPRPGPKASVMVIPKEAIIERGQLTGTFVVGDDSVARLRWVVLGEAKDGDVPVITGLREGDRVILSPSADMADGRKVRELR
jgi:RND family efflux transporter MFP subunit